MPCDSICAGVQAAGAGQRADQLRTHAVGGLAQVADAGAGVLADPVAPAPAVRRRCGCCAAALPSSSALRSAPSSDCGNGPGRIVAAWPAAARRCPCCAATAAATSASDCSQALGAAIRLLPIGIAQSSSQRMQADGSVAPLRAAWRRRCANSGWSLRRNEPIDEGRLQRRQRGDRGAEPARRTGRRGVGEIGMAQCGSRCSRCPGRAPAWPAGAVPRPCCAAVASAPMPCGTELALDALQAVGHVAQRGVPVHRLPLAALLDHRRGQPRRAVQRLVARSGRGRRSSTR